jgi:glucose-1-phosphate thymidylyltransferase
MKGVILAAGMGTRLANLTRGTNKHFYRINGKPMIHYPVERLKQAGIEDIAVIVHQKDLEAMRAHLGDDYQYLVQDINQQGIAKAIATAEEFVGDNDFVVHLGDQIYTWSLRPFLERFQQNTNDCRLILKETGGEARHHTVIYTRGDKITNIVEKPDVESGKTMIGIYAFRPSIFDYIRRVEKSQRGEYEICDAIRMVHEELGKVGFEVIEEPWFDAGTPENVKAADEYLKEQNE